MTAGANDTESVSFLAYRQTISRVEIGLGSAVSVLLFLCRGAHRLRLHQGLQDRPGAGEGGALMSTREKTWWWIAGVVILLYCLFPIAWIVSLSFKAPARHRQRASSCPRTSTWENYSTILTGSGERPVPAGAAQLLRHLPDRDVHLVHPGDVRRLRDRAAGLPRQEADPVHGAGRGHLPGDLDRHAAVQPVAADRALRHLARADHPVPVADAADLDLDACRRSSARSRGRWSRPPRSTAPRPGRRSAR